MQTSRDAATPRFPVSGVSPERPATASRSANSQAPTQAHDIEQWKQTIREHEDEQVLLHQTVVTSKKQQLEAQYERLAKQRAFIRHEKRKLLLQNALLESERERFEASLQADWFCASAFPSVRDRRITLDVGGQIFELSSGLALKDSGSLLAALAMDDSPLSAVECGCFRIDREWWLFRYVLHFLRDGILPQDPKLLRELYLESEFWKIESLRKAIETRNMEILQLKTQQQQQDAESMGAAGAAVLLPGAKAKGSLLGAGLLGKLKANSMLPDVATKPKDPNAWWMEAPPWWGVVADKEKKEPKLVGLAALAKKADGKSKAGDGESAEDAWWKSSVYKGKDFVQLLAPKPKEKTADARNESADSPRTALLLNSTWASSLHLGE